MSNIALHFDDTSVANNKLTFVAEPSIQWWNPTKWEVCTLTACVTYFYVAEYLGWQWKSSVESRYKICYVKQIGCCVKGNCYKLRFWCWPVWQSIDAWSHYHLKNGTLTVQYYYLNSEGASRYLKFENNEMDSRSRDFFPIGICIIVIIGKFTITRF